MLPSGFGRFSAMFVHLIIKHGVDEEQTRK